VYTVAIVDDQPIHRLGMERLIRQDVALSMLASVSRAEELAGLGVHPDLVVVNLPPGIDGSSVALVARLAGLGRAIVISTWEKPPSLLTAIRAGASACLRRETDETYVATALRVVAGGGFYVCKGLREQLHAELTGRHLRKDATGLAPREVETLRFIARGFTQAQIATRMGLTQATVNTYAKRIRGKLNATNKAELTRLAIQLGHLDDRVAYPVG
jgi:DNA-binding NarL/FixJ family response regulator